MMPNDSPRKTPDRTPDDRDDDEAPETPPTEPPPQPIEDPPAQDLPPYVVTLLERVAPGPRLVKVGHRLVARPHGPANGRPIVDVAALVEEERSRWG
jgi:hypothetical protein